MTTSMRYRIRAIVRWFSRQRVDDGRKMCELTCPSCRVRNWVVSRLGDEIECGVCLSHFRHDRRGRGDPTRKRVIIESPYRADSPEGLRRNREYLLRCMRDSVARGEAPFASHLLYTQFLDDDVPAEREIGIACGLAWGVAVEGTKVYTDLGITDGMQRGIEDARSRGRPVEYREIGVGP